MLSTYSITVMVLSLFSKHDYRFSSCSDSFEFHGDGKDPGYPADCSQFSGHERNLGSSLLHPFDVLRNFLHMFSLFNWETNVVTVNGPVPIKNGTYSVQTEQNNLQNQQPCILKALTKQFRNILVESSMNGEKQKNQGKFQIRVCNIQDPIEENNNLGVPVTRVNLLLIDRSLKGGHEHLEYTIGYCLWHYQSTEQERLARVYSENRKNDSNNNKRSDISNSKNSNIFMSNSNDVHISNGGNIFNHNNVKHSATNNESNFDITHRFVRGNNNGNQSNYNMCSNYNGNGSISYRSMDKNHFDQSNNYVNNYQSNNNNVSNNHINNYNLSNNHFNQNNGSCNHISNCINHNNNNNVNNNHISNYNFSNNHNNNNKESDGHASNRNFSIYHNKNNHISNGHIDNKFFSNNQNNNSNVSNNYITNNNFRINYINNNNDSYNHIGNNSNSYNHIHNNNVSNNHMSNYSFCNNHINQNNGSCNHISNCINHNNNSNNSNNNVDISNNNDNIIINDNCNVNYNHNNNHNGNGNNNNNNFVYIDSARKNSRTNLGINNVSNNYFSNYNNNNVNNKIGGKNAHNTVSNIKRSYADNGNNDKSGGKTSYIDLNIESGVNNQSKEKVEKEDAGKSPLSPLECNIDKIRNDDVHGAVIEPVDLHVDNNSNIDDVSHVESFVSSGNHSDSKSIVGQIIELNTTTQTNKKSKSNDRFRSTSDAPFMECAVSQDKEAFAKLILSEPRESQSVSSDAIMRKLKKYENEKKKNSRKRRNSDEPSYHVRAQSNAANQKQKQNSSSMIEGSFLKAFFQNSYNMYIESSLSVRADLRVNHVQRWIPRHIVSKSYQAESVTVGHNLKFDSESDGHVLGGMSVPVDPLAGDINKMWLGLTMSKNSLSVLSKAELKNAGKMMNDIKACSPPATVPMLMNDMKVSAEIPQSSFDLSLKLSNSLNHITTATRASSIETNSSRAASCRISTASFSLSCHTDGTDSTSSIDDEDIAYTNAAVKVKIPETITIGTQTHGQVNIEKNLFPGSIQYLFSIDYFSVRNFLRTCAAVPSNMPTSRLDTDSLKSGIQSFFIYYRMKCFRFVSFDYSRFSIKKKMSILFLCIYLVFRPYDINLFVAGSKQDSTRR